VLSGLVEKGVDVRCKQGRHIEVASIQPSRGFSYDYWFVCADCISRVTVSAGDDESQCTMQAKYPLCACGADIDISAVSPSLCDPHDVALNDDSVQRMFRYHSSRYEKWPDNDGPSQLDHLVHTALTRRDHDPAVERRVAISCARQRRFTAHAGASVVPEDWI
jgi:hypothetical protein